MKRKFVTYALSLCMLLIAAAPMQAFAGESCTDWGRLQNNAVKNTQPAKNCNINYNNCGSTIKVMNVKGNSCDVKFVASPSESKQNNCVSSNCISNNCVSNNCKQNNCVQIQNCAGTGQNWLCAPSNPSAKPEIPSKPETPAKPEIPSKPETPAKPEAPEQGNDSSGNLNSYERQVVDLVNKERAAAGLSPLKINAKLSGMARAKAADMRDNNYFSHTSPVYGSPFDMMKTFGVTYTAAGENIAKGQKTPESVMNGWMNSAGHRANILNAKYDQIGVGYVTDSKGVTYWVQEFIK